MNILTIYYDDNLTDESVQLSMRSFMELWWLYTLGMTSGWCWLRQECQYMDTNKLSIMDIICENQPKKGKNWYFSANKWLWVVSEWNFRTHNSCKLMWFCTGSGWWCDPTQCKGTPITWVVRAKILQFNTIKLPVLWTGIVGSGGCHSVFNNNYLIYSPPSLIRHHSFPGQNVGKVRVSD